jgi:hypothetical protein
MLAAILSGCSGKITPAPLQTRESTTENSALPSAALFLDADLTQLLLQHTLYDLAS